MLRGAGSDARRAQHREHEGGPVLAIGTLQDTGLLRRRASTRPRSRCSPRTRRRRRHVRSRAASGFAAGDLALIDQNDDAEVSEGDCGTFFKRAANTA